MKGVIFTEFIEMVEGTFSPELADRIITECELASGGAYTSVGNYDHREILQLVGKLSEATGIDANELVRAYGEHLFGHFIAYYPEFFTGKEDALTFLSSIEDHVHSEVRKLYPDAELPHFKVSRPDPDTLEMLYESPRPFGGVASGLIQGCCRHYQDPVDVEEEDLSEEGITRVRFTLRRR